MHIEQIRTVVTANQRNHDGAKLVNCIYRGRYQWDEASRPDNDIWYLSAEIYSLLDAYMSYNTYTQTHHHHNTVFQKLDP